MKYYMGSKQLMKGRNKDDLSMTRLSWRTWKCEVQHKIEFLLVVEEVNPKKIGAKAT